MYMTATPPRNSRGIPPEIHLKIGLSGHLPRRISLDYKL